MRPDNIHSRAAWRNDKPVSCQLIWGRGPCRDCEAIPVFGAELVWLVPEWELGLPDEEEPKDLPEEADEDDEWLL